MITTILWVSAAAVASNSGIWAIWRYTGHRAARKARHEPARLSRKHKQAWAQIASNYGRTVAEPRRQK